MADPCNPWSRAFTSAVEFLEQRQHLGPCCLVIDPRLRGMDGFELQQVLTGMLNKQIAAELGIAEKTIKVHRGRVMRKTGVVSVAGLVKLAITAGLPGAAGNPHAS